MNDGCDKLSKAAYLKIGTIYAYAICAISYWISGLRLVKKITDFSFGGLRLRHLGRWERTFAKTHRSGETPFVLFICCTKQLFSVLFVVRVWWKWIVCIHRSRHFSWKGNLGWNNLLRKKCLQLFLSKYFVSLQWTSLLLYSKYSWPCLVEIIPHIPGLTLLAVFYTYLSGIFHINVFCLFWDQYVFGAYSGEILVLICFWWRYFGGYFWWRYLLTFLGSILPRRVFGGGGCHQWEDGEAGRQHATLYEDEHHHHRHHQHCHLHHQQHMALWGENPLYEVTLKSVGESDLGFSSFENLTPPWFSFLNDVTSDIFLTEPPQHGYK